MLSVMQQQPIRTVILRASELRTPPNTQVSIGLCHSAHCVHSMPIVVRGGDIKEALVDKSHNDAFGRRQQQQKVAQFDSI